MEEIIKHINETNASYRSVTAGDAKNTDLFLDNEHYEMFRECGEHVTVRFSKENLTKAILFISSILPRKFDQSAVHKVIRFSKEFVLDQLLFLDALFTEKGESVNTITQVWNLRKDVPKKNGEIDKRFYFNGLLKNISFVDHNGNTKNDVFTVRNYLAGGYSELHIKKSLDGIFDVTIENVTTPFDDGKEDGLECVQSLLEDKAEHLQQIFYGAPGTGKSYKINEITQHEDVIRTTFHPDSDYSTFVGAYKPTTIEEDVMTVIGTKAVPVENPDGSQRKESKIVYEFVEQAFLQAYTSAWKKYAKATDGNSQKQYLVIEEINRGNCAQIFGDLFQLLDRNASGFSDYPVSADADMRRQLKKAFQGIAIENAVAINSLYNGRNVCKEIIDGDILLLPNNLYIWATMNTSDQSLFPIDSAFKRRWDWTYRPITDAELGWQVKADGNLYDWWNFIEKINEKIGSTTNSEDKKLGYFFCKASDGIISAETFVGKVVFYLWNDVFKDYEFGDSIFDDGKGSKLTFDKFYTAILGVTKVVEENISLFMRNLGVEAIDTDNEEYVGQPESSESTEDERQNWRPTQIKRYEFWEEFLNYAQQNIEFNKYFGGVKKATKDYWKNFFITGMDFYLVALQQRKKNAAEVQVYFDTTNETYHRLFAHKEEIEREIGINYEWKELPDKKSSIISERKFGVNFDNRDEWQSLFDFYVDRLLRMREVFSKYANI